MPSMCTQLAARSERLARAQRAFWDAWKAVSSGDGGRFAEARKAKRALENLHHEIMFVLDKMYNPDRLIDFTAKQRYRRVKTLVLDSQAHTIVRCLQTDGTAIVDNFDSGIFIWQQGRNGSYINKRLTGLVRFSGMKKFYVNNIVQLCDGRYLVELEKEISDDGDFVKKHAVYRAKDRGDTVHFVKEADLLLDSIDSFIPLKAGSFILLTNDNVAKHVQPSAGQNLQHEMVFCDHVKRIWTLPDDVCVIHRGDGELRVFRRDEQGIFVPDVVHTFPSTLFTVAPDGRLAELVHGGRQIRLWSRDEDGRYAVECLYETALEDIDQIMFDWLTPTRIALGGSGRIVVLELLQNGVVNRVTDIHSSGENSSEYVALPSGQVIESNYSAQGHSDMNLCSASADARSPESLSPLLDGEGVAKTCVLENGRILVVDHRGVIHVLDGDPIEEAVKE